MESNALFFLKLRPPAFARRQTSERSLGRQNAAVGQDLATGGKDVDGGDHDEAPAEDEAQAERGTAGPTGETAQELGVDLGAGEAGAARQAQPVDLALQQQTG